MRVSDVRPRMKNVDLELRIVEVENPRRYFTPEGREGIVTTATGEDDSGRIKVSLWNEEIERVRPGCRVKITNGYAKIFKGELHVSAGKYGKLEAIQEGE